MKKAHLIFLVLSLTVLFIVSCSDSTSPDKEGKIEGRVVDANGNPIAEASIMFTYNFQPTEERPLITINYFILEQSDVKLWISHHNQSDTLKVLRDEVLTAGQYHSSWNCKDSNDLTLLSNYYDYHIMINDEHRVKTLFLHMYYEGVTGSSVQNFQALALTSSTGKFSLDLAGLPFSYSDNAMELTDENGETLGFYSVSRTVKVWALHPEFDPVFLDSVYISETGAVINDLVLE